MRHEAPEFLVVMVEDVHTLTKIFVKQDLGPMDLHRILSRSPRHRYPIFLAVLSRNVWVARRLAMLGASEPRVTKHMLIALERLCSTHVLCSKVGLSNWLLVYQD